MKMLKPLSASAVLAAVFCGTAAQADVTAAQVWQDWKTYYTEMGQTIAASTEEMEGDTLVVKGVTFSSQLPQGSSEGTIAEVWLKEIGDGTVEVTMSTDIPLVIHTKPAEGDATDSKMTLSQTGMVVMASGTPASMDYTYTAPEVSLSMDDIAVEGKTAPIKMKLTLTGNTGKSHIENADTRVATSEMKADALEIAVTGAEPEGGGTFNMTGKMNGLSGVGTMRTPKGVDMKDMNAAMQAGMMIDGNFAFADGAYKIEATGPDGDFTADSAGAAGSMRFSMSKDGIAYGGESTDNRAAT